MLLSDELSICGYIIASQSDGRAMRSVTHQRAAWMPELTGGGGLAAGGGGLYVGGGGEGKVGGGGAFGLQGEKHESPYTILGVCLNDWALAGQCERARQAQNGVNLRSVHHDRRQERSPVGVGGGNAGGCGLYRGGGGGGKGRWRRACHWRAAQALIQSYSGVYARHRPLQPSESWSYKVNVCRT